MKQLVFLFIFIGLTFPTIAQKQINEGQITMILTHVDAEDEAIKQQAQMMSGSQTIVSFNQDYSALNISMMEGMISMKTITELSSGDSKMFMDAMGMKYVIPMSKSEKNQMVTEQAGNDGFSVEYDKSDTKLIAGYNCYKATVVNDNDIVVLECYITSEISADPKLLQGFEYIDLEGFPLEYTMGQESMKMTFTASEFSTNVEESEFRVNEADYQTMSFEEFSRMGGGMGF